MTGCSLISRVVCIRLIKGHDYFGVSDQQRNYYWQSICSKVEHVSDEGADVLPFNPAAK